MAKAKKATMEVWFPSESARAVMDCARSHLPPSMRKKFFSADRPYTITITPGHARPAKIGEVKLPKKWGVVR